MLVHPPKQGGSRCPQLLIRGWARYLLESEDWWE